MAYKHRTPDLGGCRPTPQQELLLKAVLLDDGRGQQAWEDWQSLVDLTMIDPSSYELLPLLYWKLQNDNESHAWMPVLKGIFRSTWYANKLMLHQLQELLLDLSKAEIPAVPLKGSAFLLAYYQNDGLRIMADIDILVSVDQVPETMDLIQKQGWINQATAPPQSRIPLAHSTTFRHPQLGTEMDLHWLPLEEALLPDLHEGFWKHTAPYKVDNIDALLFLPTYQLFQACVHGFTWKPDPPLRWIADAMLILKQANGKIDWGLLEGFAMEHRVQYSMFHALLYLRQCLDAQIPDNTLQALAEELPNLTQRMEHYNRTHALPWLGLFPTILFRYLRIHNDASQFSRFAGFPDFLLRSLMLDRFSQLPGYLIDRLRERLRTFGLFSKPRSIL